MHDLWRSSWGFVVVWLVTMVPFWIILWWVQRRSQREAAERQRQYAVQQQVWEIERQIWDEGLSEEARAAQRQACERAAEVKREARRRLGLPEEEDQP